MEKVSRNCNQLPAVKLAMTHISYPYLIRISGNTLASIWLSSNIYRVFTDPHTRWQWCWVAYWWIVVSFAAKVREN